MIFFTPMDGEAFYIEKSLFFSTEAGKLIASKVNSGEMKFNLPMFFVHPPYKGLITPDYGPTNNLRVSEKQWLEYGLPPQYKGENLTGKKLVVFPMHGLGDQMYLAAAIRHVALKYKNLSVTIVRASIESVEQWYPFIYGEPYFDFTGPIVSSQEMKTYDFYMNAEHFAHLPKYKGAYPPVFYLDTLFFEACDEGGLELPPKIFLEQESPISEISFIEKYRKRGRKVVYFSSVTTGRVRDFTQKTVVDFIRLCSEKYCVIVSTFKRENLRALLYSEKDNENIIFDTDLGSGISVLMNIIRAVDFVVTPDSGITHLAEALGTYCGSVFNVVTPEERVGPYKFSESLWVEFGIPSVCKTPCYYHALEEGALCAGMEYLNKFGGGNEFYDFPPCMLNLTGGHLMALLEALHEKSLLTKEKS